MSDDARVRPCHPGPECIRRRNEEAQIIATARRVPVRCVNRTGEALALIEIILSPHPQLHPDSVACPHKGGSPN